MGQWKCFNITCVRDLVVIHCHHFIATCVVSHCHCFIALSLGISSHSEDHCENATRRKGQWWAGARAGEVRPKSSPARTLFFCCAQPGIGRGIAFLLLITRSCYRVVKCVLVPSIEECLRRRLKSLCSVLNTETPTRCIIYIHVCHKHQHALWVYVVTSKMCFSWNTYVSVE